MKHIKSHAVLFLLGSMNGSIGTLFFFVLHSLSNSVLILYAVKLLAVSCLFRHSDSGLVLVVILHAILVVALNKSTYRFL